MNSESKRFSAYASPPCFAHELEYTADGFNMRNSTEQADVNRWRDVQRQRLIGFRQGLPVAERDRLALNIIDEIKQRVDPGKDHCISVYWPYRGEPNLHELMSSSHSNGARMALPVVINKQSPLVFRQWTPGCELERGVLKIPIPTNGAELIPNVVIAPLVGFDRQCYRLGYGGGYFDRTLAAMSPRPFIIGIGHRGLELETIYPQAHDIPMDIIITGKGQVLQRPDN